MSYTRSCHRKHGCLLNTCLSFILITWPYNFSRFSLILLDAPATSVVPLMWSFRMYPSLTRRVSIPVSSSHFLLVVLLTLSFLPRSLHHTTELVWQQFCKHFPSVSLATSCGATLHCVSSNFFMTFSRASCRSGGNHKLLFLNGRDRRLSRN